MIQRIYIDTSVVGGIYDDEFDVPTKMFFDKAFRGEIVNLKRIRGYNSINLREGLHTLEIRSPKELMEYED